MPKETSEKQRRANRQDARKSRSRRAGIATGPKTAAGKARVARNALKHALLAANVVADTPNENRTEFGALLPCVPRRLERKATTLRAERNAAQRQQILHDHQLAQAASLPDSSEILKVVRYETMLDRRIHRAFAELRRPQTIATEGRRRKK